MTNQSPLLDTDFQFPNQQSVYHGKVRDMYDLNDKLLMIATDRYSSFDRPLTPIAGRGELLTAICKWWFEQTEHIVKNHIISFPDPNVAICKKHQMIGIEMVVRGYITGVTQTSLWQTYSGGQRDYGTFTLPEGLKKNNKLPQPVLTPTTKFEKNDRNLTPAEAVSEGLVSQEIWDKLQEVAVELFEFGQKAAAEKGLILVDTKYEFGLNQDGELVLCDEIHTPDSSRYWLAETYRAKLDAGEEPDNYDREYLRLWYAARFNPYQDSEAPVPPQTEIDELLRRYTFIYEQLSGQTFTPNGDADILQRIETNVLTALKNVEEK